MNLRITFFFLLLSVSFAGWAQQQKSGAALSSPRETGPSGGPVMNSYQPSTGNVMDHSGSNVQPASVSSTPHYSAPTEAGTFQSTGGSTPRSRKSVKNTDVDKTTPKPAPVKIIKDSSANQGVLITPGSNPNLQKTAAKRNESTNDLLVLTRQSRPVIFYRHNMREYYFNAMGSYGVQVAYFKNFPEAREALLKYKKQFKTAGFVCEDWNLVEDRDIEKYPYRVIMGYFTRKSAAYKLLFKLRHFFPDCFVVRYA